MTTHNITAPSVSDHLSIEEVVARLKSSPLVDGVAEFGSRTTSEASAVSDHDLLVLAKRLPALVFQMVTTIGGRLADILLVGIETADELLTTREKPKPGSVAALFAQKMKTAHILYDASDRLHKAKELVSSEAWQAQVSTDQQESDLYRAWFWQGHGLVHLERLVQAKDQVHLSAFDMMLTSCLAGTWRSYFGIRGMAWEGEKAAIRYWAEHDSEYLGAVRMCLATTGRNEKLAIYRDIVERTIEPIGKRLNKGQTAAILAGLNSRVEVLKTVEYWQSLFG